MIGLLRRIFTKDTFASNVATLSSGTAVGQISVILAAPLLSRLFTPSDFGELQFVLSIGLIIGALSSLRYEMALPLANRKIDALNILVLSMVLAVIISIISLIVYLIEPSYLDQFYQTPAIKQLIFFVPIILLFEAKNNIFSFWFSRTKNFKVPSIAKSIIGLSTALAQITMALSGFLSGLGLLIGYVFGQLASVVWYISMFVRTKGFESPEKVSAQGIMEQASIHKKFPLFSSWNILLNTISRNLPPLLLVSYFSVAEAGFYAIGIRLLNMPLNTLGMSVGQVYYQQIARYEDQGIPMMPLLISTIGKLGGIIIIPLLLIFFTGEQLFAYVFGESWSMAGRIAASMAPFYLMRFIASPLSTIFAVLGKQHLGLLWQMFYTVITFGSFYYTRAYADFGFTIKVYSMAGAIAFLILALMTIYATYQADKSVHVER